MIFNTLKSEKLEEILKNFFNYVEINLKDINPKLSNKVKKSKFKFNNERNLFNESIEIGKLYDIEFIYDEKSTSIFKDIAILFPDENGYYYSGSKKLYSPFVIFDKYLTKEDEEETVEENEETVKINEDKKINTEIDFDNSLIIPGYFLAIFSTFLRIVNAKRKKNKDENDLLGNSINKLIKTTGVWLYKYDVKIKKKIKSIYVKIPVFFEPYDLNYIEKYTNPRKVVYPNEKVNEKLRLPNKTHIGIVDMLETPESKKIGLTLSLIDSENLKYDFKNFKFKRDNENILSFATKQIPFILHSDGARILMGSKNLKQAVKVKDAEKPLISTGNEKDFIGVNALTIYGLFKGFNFEDGIVVSESFAKKMETTLIEESKYIIKDTIPLDKNPKIESNKWIYNAGEKKLVIEWEKKEGDWVYFNDIIATVKNNKEIRYEGKYPAQIKNIPKTPVYPYKNYQNNILIEIRIQYSVKKELNIGDKLMGRHGNKGTVSKIIPDNEMPKVFFNNEYKSAEIILSPLGVVSRMNLGQLYEVHASMAQKHSDFKKYENGIDPLKTAYEDKDEILESLKKIGADEYGRFKVEYEKYTWYLTAGYQYIVRLDHCVKDKIHFSAIAKEGILSYQPLKGKSRNGGQKFGEMEFWSMYSYNNEKLVTLFSEKNLNNKYNKGNNIYSKYPESYFKKLINGFDIDYKINKNLKSEFFCTKNKNKELLEFLNIYQKNEVENYYQYLVLKKIINKLTKKDIQKYILLLLKEQIKKELKKELKNKVKFELDKIMKKIDEPLKEFVVDNFKTNEHIIKILKNNISNEDTLNNLESILNKNYEEKIFKNIEKEKAILTNKLKKYLFVKNGYLKKLVIARRLHYSGRTVITPQPLTYIKEFDLKMDIDTVLLPIEFGIEFIDIQNKNILKAKKGDNKKRIEIAKELNKKVLEEEKYVLLNRQPSLFRHSIQSFKARFWNNYTIGLPINVCEGFNADFDGDTMAVYYPTEQEINEIEKMLPSKNPLKISEGELSYSIDQDMIYGLFLLTNKSKSSIKKDYVKKIRKLLENKEYKKIKEMINKEILNEALKKATEENLTLSIFEIDNNTESMKKIRNSKCRGNDEQYIQLNQKIKDISDDKGFVHGINKEIYFNPEKGIAKRARRTLMDKKLHVADAGYFTRVLVEFLGTIKTKKEIDDFIEYEIDLNELKEGKYGKEKFLYRYIKYNNKKILLTPNELEKLPNKFILLSPKVIEINNNYFVSSKYCGKDISTLNDFTNDYIGITAGQVLGERGTQLSMETFHSGSKSLPMATVKTIIFKEAFKKDTYFDFLKSLDNNEEIKEKMGINKDKDKDKFSLLEKINPNSIYFELLYNFAQYLKKEKNIDSIKKYLSNIDIRGPLTCMSFESGLNVLEKIELNKEYIETQPRIKYAFFRSDENE
ncbi:hypothetical protein OSSY52_19020 [Tepiditoga spiralis]|uniref:DNA-directed RNA polymerase n=1 Tax=Tepiditoga spiralis TaxID=2108365 RepID=A0A7G1G5S1_9BACT|nr:hypothetical protein [Tepiditoga spiralis]BBE31761.1 hypothetical protein OSSY52_19020 [Tepiditoga spiralis]